MAKLGFKVQSNNVGVEKINDSTFEIFEMVLANFQFDNKFGRSRFFQKTFLLANISIEVVLNILFLTFSNIVMLFIKQKLS